MKFRYACPRCGRVFLSNPEDPPPPHACVDDDTWPEIEFTDNDDETEGEP